MKTKSSLNQALIFSVLSMISSQITFSQETASFDLDGLRWEKRVLLVFAPSIKDKYVGDIHTLLKENKDGVDDRDLVVAYFFEDDQGSFADSLIEKESVEAVRQKYYPREGTLTVVLIGKDGGEKMRQSGSFDIQRLFTRIDELPMRRSELEEKTFSFDSISFDND